MALTRDIARKAYFFRQRSGDVYKRQLLSKAEQEEAQSEMDKLVESLQKRQRQDAYQQIQKAAKQLAAVSYTHLVKW